MDKNDILQMIRDEIRNAEIDSQYSVSRIPYHTHNNIDAPNIAWSTISNAPNNFCVATNTNGTTPVNVFNSGGAPFNFIVTGAFLISKDGTAANVTLSQGTNTVFTIAKGIGTGTLVGATSLSNTTYKKKDVCQVVSSSAGNATVFITYKLI